jgi:ankyrin repeat protein
MSFLYIVESGSEAVIKLLLETGKININSKDYKSRILLLYTVENRKETMIKLLLETGIVNVDSKDNLG